MGLFSWLFGTDESKITDPKEQHDRGVNYQYGWGGFEQDLPKAIYWHERAAAQGNDDSLDGLGLIDCHYYKDYAKAYMWYKKAAAAGNGLAQSSLGTMYMEGLGLSEPNYERAIFWLKQAANGHNDYSSEGELGFIYFKGLGMFKPDYKQAIYWFDRSIIHGLKWPVKYLGSIYEHVLSYRDLTKAFSYYLKGADLPSPYCIRKVAYMYQNGLGVAKNIREANNWYNKIAEGREMVENLKELNVGDEFTWSMWDEDGTEDLLKMDQIGTVYE